MQQSKSQTEAKKSQSLAKIMLQRDKERRMAQQNKAYLELLKAPRGEAYLNLLKKTTELCQRLTEIDNEIKQLELEVEEIPDSAMEQPKVSEQPEVSEWSELSERSELSEQSGSSKQSELPEQPEVIKQSEVSKTSDLSEKTESEVKVTWLSTAEKRAEEQPVQTGQKRVSVEWAQAGKNQNVLQEWKEKRQKLAEMKRQRERVVQEFQYAQREFMAQLPVPENTLGIIYPEMNEEVLMKYGVICCVGDSYQNQQELLEQVQPKSKQEEEQWLKGDNLYTEHYSEELLLVEIYMKAICIVHKDGSTIVVE